MARPPHLTPLELSGHRNFLDFLRSKIGVFLIGPDFIPPPPLSGRATKQYFFWLPLEYKKNCLVERAEGTTEAAASTESHEKGAGSRVRGLIYPL